MINDLRITVLAENTARGVGLLGEHGLAFWIEADGHRILFDTGQGKVLGHNAQLLDIPLSTADTVVISHGHFDHTGGLAEVLDSNGKIDLYMHPDALAKKYHKEKAPPHRSIGITELNENSIRRNTRDVTWTREPTGLIDGVYVTGEIPRRNNFEDVGGPLYRNLACTEPDTIPDDQALYIQTTAGLVVVLGCAHAGVVNTLDYIAELTGQQKVYAVLGGMHLIRANPKRLKATVEAFRQHGVQAIGTAHCTGMRATTYLWSQAPDECFQCSVGTVLSVRDAVSDIY